MATKNMTRAAKTKTEAVEEVKAVEEVVEEAVEPKNEVIKETPVKKKYAMTDDIVCESITSGMLVLVGIKSGIVYKWADRGDIQEVEYQDVLAWIKSAAPAVMKPLVLIRDEELVAQHKQLNKVYETMYSIRDLKDVLNLPVGEMERVVRAFPEGAKSSLKNIVSSAIQNGTLDSIRKIQKLDEIFDTNLFLLTGLTEE